ncbi:hypothetical protein [Mesorhizobium sp.]|uniref:hypothetical protein n=1 Tax=Mesorhizobium sp. TaxID=1871066 RepID=UPI00257E8C21|nr:hypothetical protein [Mesorhizobium sp.]
MDETTANAAGHLGPILAWKVDLGQDFHRTAFGSNHADDPSRTKLLASMLKDTAAAPACERRRRRNRSDTIGR